MSFLRYPTYKDSSVEWLGEVPEGWDVKRFKMVFSERNVRSRDGSELLLSVSEYYGIKPRNETIEDGEHLSRAETLEGYKICFPSDLVMNIMLAWKRGLGISKHYGIVSPAYSVFLVTDGSLPAYLDYLVRSNEYITYFKSHSHGVIDSRLRLYPEVFGRLRVCLPPLPEQTQIARFLDHETARIDALIEEQQRLITLLKEKRQAVISHAVTKGLDPTVPMKDSGVEWLGEVPEHWEIRRLSRAFMLHRGYDLTRDDWQDGPYPVVTSGGVAGYQSLCMVNGPGIVIGRYGSTGTVFYVEDDFWPHNTSLYVSEAYGNDFRYGYYLMQNVSVEEHTGKSAVPGVDRNDLHQTIVPIPPHSEQRAIAHFLDKENCRLDELSEEVSQAITLLKERRAALISAAVTGKIDVRGWQPPANQPSANQPPTNLRPLTPPVPTDAPQPHHLQETTYG